MNFVNLPVPAGNGTGAAVEVGSFMAALKTVMVSKAGAAALVASVTVEVSADGGVTWGPLKTYSAPGQDTDLVVCTHMRVKVTGYVSGVAEVSVGGEEGTVSFFSLPVPAGNGVGAQVDVGAAEYIKTFVIAGSFKSVLNVEISQDGTDWQGLRSYTAPTTDEEVTVVCRLLRVRKSGYTAGVETATVTVACSVPESDVQTTGSLPHNVSIWADSVNGNDANPGTQTLPVATLERALNLAPPQWTGRCDIHFAPGSYFAPPASTANGPRTRIGRPVGPDSYPMAWLGAGEEHMLPVGSFITPTAGGVVATISDGFTSTVPAPNLSGFPVYTLNGYPIVFSRAGSPIGSALIQEAFGTTFILYGYPSIPALLPGDTWEVFQPSVQIHPPASGIWEIVGSGDGIACDLVMHSIIFNPSDSFTNPSMKFSNINVLTDGVYFDGYIPIGAPSGAGSINGIGVSFYDAHFMGSSFTAEQVYPFAPVQGLFRSMTFRYAAGFSSAESLVANGSSLVYGDPNREGRVTMMEAGLNISDSRIEIFGPCWFGNIPLGVSGFQPHNILALGSPFSGQPNGGGRLLLQRCTVSSLFAKFRSVTNAFQGGYNQYCVVAFNRSFVNLDQVDFDGPTAFAAVGLFQSDGVFGQVTGVVDPAFAAIPFPPFAIPQGDPFGMLIMQRSGAVIGWHAPPTLTGPSGDCFVGGNFYAYPVGSNVAIHDKTSSIETIA